MNQETTKHEPCCASCKHNYPLSAGKRWCFVKSEGIRNELACCSRYNTPVTFPLDPWRDLEKEKMHCGLTVAGDAEKSTHYRQGGIEPTDYIVSNNMDFLEGNVIKYVTRYKFKNSPLKDLEKAKQYIEWLIERESQK